MKRRNQEEQFAGALTKQERGEVKPPLSDGGMGTTQKGEKKWQHERRIGREPRLTICKKRKGPTRHLQEGSDAHGRRRRQAFA
jgi:hypothetical protein